MFQSRLDIANRACQLIGIPRIISFTDDTKQAQEIGFSYETLRRAELRRNTWTFATRKATIRPIGTGTMQINPVLWSSTTTYGYGAIVSDAYGVLWQSLNQANLNNDPGDATQWELYCGPMTAQPYDSTTEYSAGEIVYETPGDGTFSTYISLLNDNSQDPRVASLWVNTTQYNKEQVVQYYSAWAIGNTYAAGAAVTYNGNIYVSLAASNTGNEPDTATTWWVQVSLTLSNPYYNSTVAYVIGNFVTYLGNNYVCIAATTGNLPTNATYWALQAAPTYYVSPIDFNLNNDPSLAAPAWSSVTTYAAGTKVGGSDGWIYSSVGSGNLNNNPVTTTGFWTNTNVLNPWVTSNPYGTANDNWLQLNISLQDIIIQYPAGTGPSWQSMTKNVYRLPSNFLRRAPQDPKAGSISILGAPGNIFADDWNIEGNFLTSRDSSPITLRFIADVTNVSTFDDLFCECFACRIASETGFQLTQDKQSFAQLNGFYIAKRAEAITVNAIESGPTESPLDDWIATRM